MQIIMNLPKDLTLIPKTAILKNPFADETEENEKLIFSDLSGPFIQLESISGSLKKLLADTE